MTDVILPPMRIQTLMSVTLNILVLVSSTKTDSQHRYESSYDLPVAGTMDEHDNENDVAILQSSRWSAGAGAGQPYHHRTTQAGMTIFRVIHL